MDKLIKKTTRDFEDQIIKKLSPDFQQTLKEEPCPNLRSLIYSVAEVMAEQNNKLVETYEVLSKGL